MLFALSVVGSVLAVTAAVVYFGSWLSIRRDRARMRRLLEAAPFDPMAAHAANCAWTMTFGSPNEKLTEWSRRDGCGAPVQVGDSDG